MLTEHDRALYKNYFQHNSDYYLEQIEGSNGRGKYTFNAAAFFFGVFWMAYRKMYLHVLIILGISYAIGVILEMLLNFSVISNELYELIDGLSVPVWGIVIGLIANRLYILKSQKTVNKILAENSNEEQVNELINKEGGTSWIGPIILSIVFGLIIFLSI